MTNTSATQTPYDPANSYLVVEPLQGAGVPLHLAYLAAESIREAHQADEEVLRYAAQVRDIAERAERDARSGRGVNDLGVLQSTGTYLDRACALRQAAINKRTAVLWSVARAFPESAPLLGLEVEGR